MALKPRFAHFGPEGRRNPFPFAKNALNAKYECRFFVHIGGGTSIALGLKRDKLIKSFTDTIAKE